MGASTSKVARNTANASTRRYPARSSPTSEKTSSLLSSSRVKRGHEIGEQAADGRTPAIEIDGRDPQLAASLQRIGPVQPNHTHSNSAPSSLARPDPASASPGSPTLLALKARQRIQEAVEAEKAAVRGRRSIGREFLDIPTLYKILALRDEQNMSSEEIEQLLNLKVGVVNRLGARGVVQTA